MCVRDAGKVMRIELNKSQGVQLVRDETVEKKTHQAGGCRNHKNHEGLKHYTYYQQVPLFKTYDTSLEGTSHTYPPAILLRNKLILFQLCWEYITAIQTIIREWSKTEGDLEGIDDMVMVLLLQIQLMRTQTEVTVEMESFKAAQNLFIEPDGFVIKMFFSCSRTDTKAFKISGNPTRINQKLSIRNIIGKELQFWLCNTHNKIIASATLPITEHSQTIIQFKMSNTSFAEVSAVITITKKQIEKEVIVEPDEELLRKVEDPLEKLKKEEEEERKAKELANQLSAVKSQKKAAVTLTHFNMKEMPIL